MDPITQFLSSLGPWGVLAAALVGWLAPKLLGKVNPKPTVPPAGAVLGSLLAALVERIRKVDPTADAEHVAAGILSRELRYSHECNPPGSPTA